MDEMLPLKIVWLGLVLLLSQKCSCQVDAPHFRRSPENTTVIEYGKGKLKCVAQGYPKPIVTWTFNDQPLQIKPGIKIQKSGTLNILNATSEHEGIYTCNARNAHGEIRSEPVYLEVQVPVRFQSIPENKTVAWGSEVTINCSVTGKPTPHIQWKRNNMTPVTDPETQKILTKNQLTVNVTENVTYVCEAMNRLRNDVHVITKTQATYLSYFDNTRPKGYCTSFEAEEINSVCSPYISPKQLFFMNITGQDSIDGNENILKHIFKNVILHFEDNCLRSLKGLLCNHMYPKCEIISDTRVEGLPICRGICQQVKDIYCVNDWQRFLSHIPSINSYSQQNSWVHFKPLDCDKQPLRSCSHLREMHLQDSSSTASLPSPVQLRDKETRTLLSPFLFNIIIAVSGAFFIMLVVIAIVLSYRLCRKSRRYTDYLRPVTQEMGQNVAINVNKLTKNSFYHQRLPSTSSSVTLEVMEFPRNEIVFLEDIGRGAFGTLFKARASCLERGHFEERLIAVKMLSDGASSYNEECILTEAAMMCELDHPNIIKLLGVCLQGNPICLIYEYMSEGDLTEFLRKHSPQYFKVNDNPVEVSGHVRQLNHIDQLDIAIQVASGMLYLSSKGNIHRDLATRNCLVGDHLIVKISDFALMQSKDSECNYYYRGNEYEPVPIRWMAPEVIFSNKFSTASDVWSYGILLWEIFSFAMEPYYELPKHEDVIVYIKEGSILSCPENAPDEVYDVMKECWSQCPKERPKFSSLYYKLSSLRQKYKYTSVNFDNEVSDKSAIWDGNSV